LRQPEGSLGVAADREPELGGMIGERIVVTREQLVITGLRLGAPGLRLLGSAGVAQDACELRCVIGIVGCDCQRPKAGDGRRGVSQGGIDFGEVALRRNVGRNPADRRLAPGARTAEIVMLDP
jgi:hypothetical protein